MEKMSHSQKLYFQTIKSLHRPTVLTTQASLWLCFEHGNKLEAKRLQRANIYCTWLNKQYLTTYADNEQHLIEAASD